MSTARRYTALVCLALTATSCAPEAVSLEGARVSALYRFFFYFAAVIFAVVAGLIAWNIVRYREKRPDGELPQQVRGNLALEIVWFSIPTVIVVVLFIASMNVLDVVNEKNPPSGNGSETVEVGVEAFQWGWRFDFGGRGTIESLPDAPAQIYLPVHQDITFELTSPDVIHSFYIPRFLMKRDVVPGRTNRIDLLIEDEGVYGGKCAEFCGLLHERMDFTIHAVSPETFQEWLEERFPTEGS